MVATMVANPDAIAASPDTIATLHEAVRFLAAHDADRASQWNNIGFSGCDTNLGHSLAETPAERWSQRQAYAAYKMLRRYRNTQLPKAGIDYADLPPVAMPELPVRPPVSDERLAKPYPEATYRPRAATEPVAPSKVELAGDALRFSWGWNDPDFGRKKDIIKGAGCRWNPVEKCWTMPMGKAAVELVAHLADLYADAAHPFDISDDIYERADALLGGLIEANQASRASDAAIELRGVKSGVEVMPFQRAGIAYCTKNQRSILGDDMGTGKTLQSILSMAYLDAYPALIVTPASLKYNWVKEIGMWLARPPKVQVLEGTTPTGLDPDAKIVIVNYDIIGSWARTLDAVPWQAVILDEAHYIKSGKQALRGLAVTELINGSRKSKNKDKVPVPGTKRKLPGPDFGKLDYWGAKTLTGSLEPLKGCRDTLKLALLLSGTPVLNRPIELWPLIEALGRQDEFGGFMKFAMRYCDAHQERFGWDFSGHSNLGELNERMREGGMMIRRLKADIMPELPSRRFAPVVLPMDAKSDKAYGEVEEQVLAWLEEQREARGGYMSKQAQNAALTKFNTLRQACYAAKMKSVEEWIDNFLESGRKLVIFAHHRDVVSHLAERYGAPTIMGGQKGPQTEEAKARFQEDPSVRVIVCNLMAGGVGHTLTAASDVAFVEFGWNPSAMDQCLDRCHRKGQKNAVVGHLLSAVRANGDPTIDDDVAGIISEKRPVVSAVTDGEPFSADGVSELAARLLARKK